MRAAAAFDLRSGMGHHYISTFRPPHPRHTTRWWQSGTERLSTVALGHLGWVPVTLGRLPNSGSSAEEKLLVTWHRT